VSPIKNGVHKVLNWHEDSEKLRNKSTRIIWEGEEYPVEVWRENVLKSVKMPELAKRLLKNDAYLPVDQYTLDSKTFYLSNRFADKKETGRFFALFYLLEDNQLIPRLMIKDPKDLLWLAAPSISERDGQVVYMNYLNNKEKLSKDKSGRKYLRVDPYLSAQIDKQELLESRSSQIKDLKSSFQRKKLQDQGVFNFQAQKELSFNDFSENKNTIPNGYLTEAEIDQFNQLGEILPVNIKLDLEAEPLSTYRIKSEDRGEMEVEVIPSCGQEDTYEWHFANSLDGKKTCLLSIQPQNRVLNDYGIPMGIIQSPFLNLEPWMSSNTVIRNLNLNCFPKEKDGSFDISSFLNQRHKFIADYRDSRAKRIR